MADCKGLTTASRIDKGVNPTQIQKGHFPNKESIWSLSLFAFTLSRAPSSKIAVNFFAAKNLTFPI